MTRPSGDPELAAGGRRAEAGQGPPTSASQSTADTQEFARTQPDEESAAANGADSGFRLSWRGYDREEVDRYRSRMETELAGTRSGYQRAVRAQAELHERLRAVEAELARLRGQLSKSPSALSERLREILRLAEQDAEETRVAAESEAQQMRANAQADAEQLRADAEAALKKAQDTAAGILSRAHAEQQKGRAELEQEQASARQQLAYAIAEAEQARHRADAAATARREQEDRQARERRDRDDAAAAARLRETAEQLAQLTRQREEVVAALSGLRDMLAETLKPANDTDEPQAPSS